MKKLIPLLILAFLVMTGRDALAANVFHLYVGGVEVTESNQSNITGPNITTGTVSYSGHTLTLNNATINCDGYGILLDVDAWDFSSFTIELIGTNNITVNCSPTTHAIYVRSENCTIKGPGTLNLSGNDFLIRTYRNLTIQDDCVLNLTNNSDKVSILSSYDFNPSHPHEPGNLTINHSTVNVTATGQGGEAISGYKCLSLAQSFIVAPQNTVYNMGSHDHYGLWDDGGNPVREVQILPSVSYDLYVSGARVTNGNAADILGDGKVSYDAANNTLTLDGAYITSNNAEGIYNEIPDLKIKLEGNNTINAYGSGIYSAVDCVIDGEGRLDVSGSDGIKASGDLTIQGGCEVHAMGTGSGAHAGIYGSNGKTFTVDASILNATCSNGTIGTIFGFSHLDLTSCLIKNPSNAVYDEADRRLEVGGAAYCGEVVIDLNYFIKGYFKYTLIEDTGSEHYVSIGAAVPESVLPSEITIPATVTNNNITYKVKAVTGWGFYRCRGIQTVRFEDNPYFNAILHYAFYQSSVREVLNVPSTTEQIGYVAFAQCYDLVSFRFAGGTSHLGRIDISAFYDDDKLQEFSMPGYLGQVVIPETTYYVGSEAFAECSSISSVVYKASQCEENNSEASAFSNCTSLTHVTIGERVRYIPTDIFAGNTNITHLELHTKVSSAAGTESKPAFRGCTNLSEVDLADATHIPAYLMMGNTAVNNVDLISSNVAWIGDYAFKGCTGLTSIGLPASLSTIGEAPFQGVSVGSVLSNMENPRKITLISESFESYPLGSNIAVASLAAEHSWWTTWLNDPGSTADGVVANYGGNRCGHLTYGNDQFFLLGNENDGEYDLEFDILVPNGKNGYFSVLHDFAGLNSTWAMQCYLHLNNDDLNTTSAPGHATVHAGSSNTADIACVYDDWMHFRLHVNTGTDLAEFFYTAPNTAEQSVCSWQWSLNCYGDFTAGSALSAVNFFPPMNENSEFYVDNVVFTKLDGPSDLLISDEFETYPLGSNIATASTATRNYWWTTWSNAPGGSEDGLVANEGWNQCGHLTYGNDQVLLLGNENEGEYDLEFDILVPNGKNGYFSVLHDLDGLNSTWAMQAYLHLSNQGNTSDPGQATIYAGSETPAVITNCVYDDWMHFRLHVNTVTDRAEFFYTEPNAAEQQVCSWVWSLNCFGNFTAGSALSAVNFWPPKNNSEFYVDNVVFKKQGVVRRLVNESSLGFTGSLAGGKYDMAVPHSYLSNYTAEDWPNAIFFEHQSHVGESFDDDYFTYTVLSEIYNAQGVLLGGDVSVKAKAGATLPAIIDIHNSYRHYTDAPANTVYVDYWITAIEEEGFMDHDELKEVRFVGSSHFTTIGKGAFRDCDKLEEVTNVPASLEVIDYQAFYECVFLNNFEFANVSPTNLALTTIAEEAFGSCLGLKNFYVPTSQPRIYIPPYVTELGDEAFSDLNVDMIEYAAINIITEEIKRAFTSCEVSTLHFDSQVQSIPTEIFTMVTILDSIVLAADNCHLEHTPFFLCGGGPDSPNVDLWVEPNVRYIPESFLSWENFLYRIIFDERNSNHSQCTTIGYFAFCSSSLESINVYDDEGIHENMIPASLETIECVAFCNCTNLQTIAYPSNSRLKTIGCSAFENSGIRAMDAEGSDFTLNRLNFPASLTYIDRDAFEGCDAIHSIRLPYSMTLANNAFKDCTNLEWLYLNSASLHYETMADPEEDHPFKGCTSLSKVRLEDNVQSIPDYFMYKNSSLNDVAQFGAYRPFTIGNYAFYDTDLVSFDISHVTSIGDYAFSDCDRLTTILYRYNSTLTHIGDNAFEITNLSTFRKSGTNDQGICLPEGLEYIGAQAFSGVATDIVSIPTTVSYIGSCAFQGNYHLTTVNYNAEEAEIGSFGSVFRNCGSLNTFTIGSAVKRCVGNLFGNPAYNEIPPISVVNFQAVNCQRISKRNNGTSSLFEDLSVFGMLTVAEGVTRLPDAIFHNCAALSTVTFPSSLTYIGDHAFEGCSLVSAQGVSMNPHELQLPFYLTYLGEKAFSGSTFGSVYIPSSCVTMGENPLDGVKPYSIEINLANGIFNNNEVLTEAYLFGSTEFGSDTYELTVRGDVASNNYNTTNWPHANIYVDEPWSYWSDVITDINLASSDGMSNAVISTSQTLTADRSVNGLVIKEGVTITVPSGMTLRASTGGEFTYNFAGYTGIVVEDGGQVFSPISVVTMKKDIQAYTPGASDNWYLLSTPFCINDGMSGASNGISPTAVVNMLDGTLGSGNNHYDLYSYSESDSTWINYEKQPATFMLEDAHGYLYANAQNTTLQFRGMPNATSTIDVPLTYNPFIPAEDPDNPGIGGTTNPEMVLGGFNLVGNPYSHNITYQAFDNMNQWQGYVFILNESGEEVVAFADDDYYTHEFKPMEGFFVKSTGEEHTNLHFEYMEMRAKDTEVPVVAKGLTIHLEQDGKDLDHAYLRLEERERIEKVSLFGGSSRIYFMEDSKSYAAVSFNENIDGKPLYFTPSREGQYTLSFNTRGEEYSYLHLIDRKTGTDIDLLGEANGSYTFEASVTDSANRFVLIIKH